MIRSSLKERAEVARNNAAASAAAAAGAGEDSSSAAPAPAAAVAVPLRWRASVVEPPVGAEVVLVRLVKSEDRQTRSVESALRHVFSAEAQADLSFAARFLYEPRVPPGGWDVGDADTTGAGVLPAWRDSLPIGGGSSLPRMPALTLPPGKVMPWALNEDQVCVAPM